MIITENIGATVFMGADLLTPAEAAKKSTRKRRLDKENYLFEVNVFDIELPVFKGQVLAGRKKVGRLTLEKIALSNILMQNIPVIASPGVEASFEEYTFALPHRGKVHKFIPLPQASNRYDSLHHAIQWWKVQGHKGFIYAIGGDIPQAHNIDERIKSIAEAKKGSKSGPISAVNLHLITLQDLAPWWRNPFFLGNVFKQGYKEPQDYLLDPSRVDLSVVSELNPDPKMGDLKTQKEVIQKAKEIAEDRLMQRYSGWYAKLQAYWLLGNAGLAAIAYKQFQKSPRHYPFLPAGHESSIFGIIGRVIAPQGGLNIGLSSRLSSGYYKDLDSLQDAFRHAWDMRYEHNKRMTFDELDKLNPEIRYQGVPLVEFLGVDKKTLFADLIRKQYMMAKLAGFRNF